MSQAEAGPYQPAEAPTVAEIQHLTEASSPPDRTRTTIGILEKVSCWIDTSTWRDKDCDMATFSLVDDSIGTITWCAKGGSATVYPTTGSATTMSAGNTGGAATVEATVPDSGAKGVDTPLVKKVDFAVVVPVSNYYVLNQDVFWWEGQSLIGTKAIWDVWVEPRNVSFTNVEFRENIPGESFTWPDGKTPGSFPAKVKTYSLDENNRTDDKNQYSSFAIAVLAGKAFQLPGVRVPCEYQGPTWIMYCDETHPFMFDAAGRGINGMAVPGKTTVWCSWKGPWSTALP